MANRATTTITGRLAKYRSQSQESAPSNNNPPAPEPLPFEKPWDRNTVAAFLGLTPSGLDKLVVAGKAPPHFRAGRRLRWQPSIVRKWAENGGSEPHPVMNGSPPDGRPT
jgi:predicted DNA-binding transcriptional regulator AlpA